MAREAYEEAIAKLDSLGNKSYKETSLLILQLMRDNLNRWASDMEITSCSYYSVKGLLILKLKIAVGFKSVLFGLLAGGILSNFREFEDSAVGVTNLLCTCCSPANPEPQEFRKSAIQNLRNSADQQQTNLYRNSKQTFTASAKQQFSNSGPQDQDQNQIT
ncbi:hypothetical protein TEA_008440 [Camellia sinensis var. sinensis]|uniref:14-3-3 domain-containing protein n=1 Tax=Camellia sinensis var. sinensis TaxID=542762 RepID=A0A4V3WR61_CAMSN|nr:hypothetical protein TEA_008440 [Camellia sinensis var. sinensis]